MYNYKIWKKETFKRMTSSSKAHVARRQQKLCDIFAPGVKPVTQKQKMATAKRKQLSNERRKKLLAATRKRLAAEGRKELSNERRKNAGRF